jgi:5,10-methylenetetrahydromethanopterin reductase
VITRLDGSHWRRHRDTCRCRLHLLQCVAGEAYGDAEGRGKVGGAGCLTASPIDVALAVAAATSRVRIGTAVANPFTPGAVLSAVTCATLNELAQGRAIFGFGPGSPHIPRRQGYDFDLPVTRMKEHIEVVCLLLTGERISYRGCTVIVDNVVLDFTPFRTRMPLYLGVTGPKALGLAGENADGVILNGFVSADYSRRAVERVREAATQAGAQPCGSRCRVVVDGLG